MNLRPEMISLRRPFGVFAAAVLCAMVCVTAGRSLAEPLNLARDPESLLMTINDQEVRQRDMDTLMQVNFGPKFSNLTAIEKEAVRINRASETRSQLVDRVLLVTAARVDGIAATKAELSAQIEQIKKELPQGMTFDGYLKGIGVKASDFLRHAEDQVVINKLSTKRTAGIAKPTDAEIEIYYKQNPDYFARKERAHVSHVLISTLDAITDEQRAAKRAEAEVVRRRLLASGPDAFAEVALEVSNCPSKEHGGDLGLIEKGAMVPAFDEAAFSQEIGAIGRVVRTPKGYHVLRVTERLPAEKLTLKDARGDIAAVLSFRKRDQAMEGYLQTLRLSAKVVQPKPASAKKK